MLQYYNSFHITADCKRSKFLATLPESPVTVHTIDRANILSTVVALFRQDGICEQFPLHISFKGEIGVDVGGVYRDMLSALWEHAYETLFDGGCLLTPQLHPASDLSALPVIGKVLSHGFIGSGFLPVNVAFPTLALMLLEKCEVSDDILLSTFLDTLSTIESFTLSKALVATEFSQDLQDKLVEILGKFNCRTMPRPENLNQLVIQVARFDFMTKPSTAVAFIRSGIPSSHRDFLCTLSQKRC